MVLSQDEDAPDVAGLHEVDGHDPLITEPFLHHSGEEETMKVMWHVKKHKGANKASFSKLNCVSNAFKACDLSQSCSSHEPIVKKWFMYIYIGGSCPH